MRILLLTVAVLLTVTSSSQIPFTDKATIEVDEIVSKNGIFEQADEILTIQGSTTYLLQSKAGLLKFTKTLIKYEQGIGVTSSIEIPDKIDKEKVEIEFVEFINNRFVVFCSDYNKRKDLKEFFYFTIDAQTFQVNETLTPIGELTFLGYDYREVMGYDHRELTLSFSDDQSKLLLFTRSMNTCEMIVMNKSLKVLWSRKIDLPVAVLLVQEVKVLNDGSVHILNMALADEEGNELSEENLNLYEITSVFKTKAELQKTRLKLDKKFDIEDISMTLIDNSVIGVAGLFREKEEVYSSGAFLVSVDIASSEQSVVFDKFDDILLAEEGAIKDLVIRNLFVNEDQEIFLIAEQYNSYEYPSGDSYRVKLNFDDLVIYSFKENVTLKWKKRLQKPQESDNQGGIHDSFSVIQRNDGFDLLYNLSAKEFFSMAERQGMEGLNRFSNLIMLTSVSRDGEITEEVLSVPEDKLLKIVPMRTYIPQLYGNEVQLYLLEKNKERFGRLIYHQ